MLEANNSLVLNALKQSQRAVLSLSKAGVTVVDVSLAVPSRPTLKIQRHGYCEYLLQQGAAIYYVFGHSDKGHYRQGQFLHEGCRIIWTEPGR